MNKLLVALLAVLTASSVFLFNYNTPVEGLEMNNSSNINDLFNQWKMQHGKFFQGSENQYRLQVFTDNYNYVQQFNKSSDDLKLGMNAFAALTNTEFQELMLTQITNTEYSNIDSEILSTQNLPTSVNWIQKGAVTDVKNQGTCGACWAFAATTGLEGLRAITEGNLESLSAQQLVSCMQKPFSLGCDGGNAIFAYNYTKNKGIETYAEYPYVQENTKVEAPCEYDASKTVFQNKGSKSVSANQPEQMKAAVAEQPITVAVAGAAIAFQLYNSGVLSSETCGTNLNHAIGVVGYNTEESKPYWIVKNSWGTTWGEDGFGKILISNGDGICGINMEPTYPTA